MVNIVLAIVALLIAIAYGFGIAAIPSMMISDVLGPTAYPKLLLGFLLCVAGLLFVEGIREKNFSSSVAQFRNFMREESFVFFISALSILAFFLLFGRSAISCRRLSFCCSRCLLCIVAQDGFRS